MAAPTVFGGMDQITSSLINWVKAPITWAIIMFGAVFLIFLILIIRRKRRLNIAGIEVVDLGKGKTALNSVKCGWFGEKIYAKGLWWSGRSVMRNADMNIIQEFSTTDYQEVNGRRGIVYYRDPLNRNILAPINNIGFKNKEFVAEIAPASLRDAAVVLFNDAVKETGTLTDKILQFLGWALVVIFSLVTIIIIVQYANNSQKAAADLLVQAGTRGKEACLEVLKTASDYLSSNAP